jgi:hypothetical protein
VGHVADEERVVVVDRGDPTPAASTAHISSTTTYTTFDIAVRTS